MKVLVTGKDGQLGRAFQKGLQTLFQNKYSKVDIRYIGRQDCDLADLSALENILHEFQPSLIINAAAYTAVDKAEQEQEQDLVFAINTVVPEFLAKYAVTHNSSLMHYSTDYVFDGEGSNFYSEDRAVRPLGVYGKSKAEGERLIVNAFTQSNNGNARFVIFRTSWVYGEGGNFIRTILRLAKDRSELKVIADQFGVPTSADWLAALSTDFLFDLSADSQVLLRDFPSGIYHAVPAGETTWHGLACEAVKIARESGLSLATEVADIKAISATEHPLPAARPMNSRMSTQKLQKTLKDLGAVSKFPVWNELVRDYVSELVKKRLN
jgi:dTDP-4-dehydrorhamnose reductase